jgi:hypothetical protein
MLRAQWIALVLLAAVGCIAGESGRFGSAGPEPFGGDLEREIHEGLAVAEETAGRGSGERTGNVTLVVQKILVDRRDTINIESAWRYADEHVVAGGGELARRKPHAEHIAQERLDGSVRAVRRALEPGYQGREPRADQAGRPDRGGQVRLVDFLAMRALICGGTVFCDYDGPLGQFHLLDDARGLGGQLERAAAVQPS